MTDPAGFALFAWQTGWVFTLRSLQMAAQPAEAATSLAAFALEKQKAFAEGAVAAATAVMRGADPAAIAEAALHPARRRVAANHRALCAPKRRSRRARQT